MLLLAIMTLKYQIRFISRNTKIMIQQHTTIRLYQDGAQRNKGFEAEIVANPINGLNIVFGYSYNDAILTAGDHDFVDHRPESAGPQNLANLWASYKFTTGRLKRFWFRFWRKLCW